MLIFDQLNKADRPLRLVSWFIATGLVILLGGLWWVQVVRARQYAEDQFNQSYRTVRVPAPRGKITDRHGVVLAENQATYNVSLYLGDPTWRQSVQQQYRALRDDARRAGAVKLQPSAFEKFLSIFGYEPSLLQLRRISRAEETSLGRAARYTVTSNIVAQLGEILGTPLRLDETNFHRHYYRSLVLPLPILSGLNDTQIARLHERGLRLPGVDMEIQPVRVYPRDSLAAHLIGYMRQSDESVEGELAHFDYRLPDFRGVSGLEYSLDHVLRGKAGAKSVQINNLGYRQSETFWSPIEAGHDVVLSIDAAIQRKVEYELARAPKVDRHPVRGAAVVLDCRTGEILALASAPTFEPGKWLPRPSLETFRQYNDTNTTPLLNRAIYNGFSPGSTFKTIVALAAMEAGNFDPQRTVHVAPHPTQAGKGIFYVGEQGFRDTAGSGDFNFRRAFIKSSNGYFIQQALWLGRDRVLNMAWQLGFGERTGIPHGQDSAGILPTQEWLARKGLPWRDGDTANLSIGQGYLTVTPLQMAVAMAAVANGGRVLWPQLVIATNSQDDLVTSRPVVRPQVRHQLGIDPRALAILQDAMLADTEGQGSGREAYIQDYRVCAKTGTAQIERGRQVVDLMTWFASYAPFDHPRYAVVVMVQSGESGGTTCAPVAKKIYEFLRDHERKMRPLESVAVRQP